MNFLSIFINDQLAYEYDRTTELDENQQAYLDKMDTDMDKGFKISGEMIANPDTKQKATFISMNLLRALKQEDDARLAVYCAYLSARLPNTIEVHASDGQNRIDIEFVEQH